MLSSVLILKEILIFKQTFFQVIALSLFYVISAVLMFLRQCATQKNGLLKFFVRFFR